MNISRRDFLKLCAQSIAVAGFSQIKIRECLASQALTENVFIVIMDGIRCYEAFHGPNPEQYIPHIWNDLRPLGTIYTNFYDTGITLTAAGHQQLLCGVRQLLQNDGMYKVHQRTVVPSIFEYYRKDLGVPMDEVWAVYGKAVIIGHIDHSIHPDYGYTYRTSNFPYGAPDLDVWQGVQDVMDTYHPSLMLVNLRDVDLYGHWVKKPNYDFDDYLNAILIADQIIYDLWQKIQSDPVYADKTTFIVTTDHGRNPDGFMYGVGTHRGCTHSNRHLMFLAIGPDIKQDTVIPQKRDMIDIPPTVGELLGFNTPHVEGSVMTEMFSNPALGHNNVTGGLRKPKIAVNQDGIHMVYAAKADDEWDIYYKKSADFGLTWTEPIKLFESTQQRLYYEADITATDSFVFVAATGYEKVNYPDDPSYFWKLFGRRSIDGGENWSGIKIIGKCYNLTNSPAIASHGGKVGLSALQISKVKNAWKLRSFLSTNRGFSWSYSGRINNDGANKTNIMGCSLAMNKADLYAVWQAVYPNSQDFTPTQRRWNLFINDYDLNTSSWGALREVTSNLNRNSYLYNPKLAVSWGGFLRLVWAKRRDENTGEPGIWTIYHSGSGDRGNSWNGPVRLSDPGIDSCNPDLVLLNGEKRAPALVVWESHEGAISKIRGRFRYPDGWGDIIELSEIDDLNAANPDVASYGDNFYLTWQDRKDGYWDVYCKQVLI